MSQQDPLDRIVAALHDAALDESQWSATSALIDDACRTKGNMLVFADGQSQDDAEIFLARFCYRGQRDEELEREYFRVYYPRDERVPRLRQLPDGQLVHVRSLYSEQEVRSSATYNEALPPLSHPEQPSRAPGRTGWFAHRLGAGGFRRRG